MSVKAAGFCPTCAAPLCQHGHRILNAPRAAPEAARPVPPVTVLMEAWPLSGQARVTVTEKGKPPREIHVAAPVLAMILRGALGR